MINELKKDEIELVTCKTHWTNSNFVDHMFWPVKLKLELATNTISQLQRIEHMCLVNKFYIYTDTILYNTLMEIQKKNENFL